VATYYSELWVLAASLNLSLRDAFAIYEGWVLQTDLIKEILMLSHDAVP